MSLKLIPPPEREKLEREVKELLNGLNMSDFARLIQRDQSAVSKAFNPYDTDRHNPVFEIILCLWGIDALSDEVGDSLLELIVCEREKWRTTVHPKKAPSDLSGKVGRELVQAFEAEIAGKDYNEQISEWHDVEVAARNKKQAVIDSRTEYYCNGNLRQFAAEANGRRKAR